MSGFPCPLPSPPISESASNTALRRFPDRLDRSSAPQKNDPTSVPANGPIQGFPASAPEPVHKIPATFAAPPHESRRTAPLLENKTISAKPPQKAAHRAGRCEVPSSPGSYSRGQRFAGHRDHLFHRETHTTKRDQGTPLPRQAGAIVHENQAHGRRDAPGKRPSLLTGSHNSQPDASDTSAPRAPHWASTSSEIHSWPAPPRAGLVYQLLCHRV